MQADPTPRILLACSGLEHARRGFESFARECFDELKSEPGISIELVKGSGPAGQAESSVRTLRRDHPIARWLGSRTGREPFRFEQAAFGLSLQPRLIADPPDIVYFSEWHTGIVLDRLRRLARRRFRLVLCNGTMATEGFEHLDLVQQLTPAALDIAVASGADPTRQALLTLGFSIAPTFAPVSPEEKTALRRGLRLPIDRPIVLSVAALNRYHKRLDYLIEEIARLPGRKPYVLLVGEPEDETESIESLARARLGPEGYDLRTVPLAEIAALYRASDIFVLASLGEALGRVFIEAMAQGLPCLAHDYAVSRFALGDLGTYADFSGPGALARLVADSLPSAGDPDAAVRRHASVRERFSWETLRPAYVRMFREVSTRPQ